MLLSEGEREHPFAYRTYHLVGTEGTCRTGAVVRGSTVRFPSAQRRHSNSHLSPLWHWGGRRRMSTRLSSLSLNLRTHYQIVYYVTRTTNYKGRSSLKNGTSMILNQNAVFFYKSGRLHSCTTKGRLLVRSNWVSVKRRFHFLFSN